MPAYAPLTYQVATSGDLPAAERYEHWLKPLLSDFEAAPPNPQQQKNFQGRLTSIVLGSRELHDMQSDCFEGSRSERRIGTHEDDKLALIYVMHGQVFSQYDGDTDTITRAGQFFLFDGARPNRMRFHRPRFIQVNVPRNRVHAALRSMVPSQFHQGFSGSRLAGLLSSQLEQFRDLSGTLTMHERYGFLEATEALATSVLESVFLDKHSFDRGRYLSVYTAAQRYIHTHLQSASLSGHAIAAALGCSRATLYRAFSEQNVSLADEIRELRLHKLANYLQNPANTVSIAQLAQHCGLHDAPNLSRLFRRHFGVSPQEFRAAHQA